MLSLGANKDHVLYNVLYIPNFTFNLLSIAKLIENLSCVIIFYSNDSHIKDKKSLKVIGSVEMQDRLYILRVSSYQNLQIKPVKSPHIPNIVNFIASDLENLWHFRLGHVSNKSIDVIKNNFLLLNITNLLFVIFVILQSKKDSSFLLVHLNLKNILI